MGSDEPKIIQGGMGVGISSWVLAGTVSRLGHLGVVSGTALDAVWVRRLQGGDIGNHFRRAAKVFPRPEIAERIYQTYFVAGGKSPNTPYRRAPMLTADPSKELQELLLLTNFVEVFLAKEGHGRPVGINYLEKIQMATLPSVYGAMLAGVDYVLMGAGIPSEIPAALDRLARGESAEIRLDVDGADAQERYSIRFNPSEILGESPPNPRRPKFLAIVSSSALALRLAKKATGRVDGFVIEGPTAGGHNAPPRGELQLNDRGEPIYGPRDEVDLKAIRALGLPFWLAGSYGSSEGLQRALSLGATGIQVGTAFALCEESGLAPELKRDLLRRAVEGKLDVFTDPQASPTGFPFKVARISGTLSDPEDYDERVRRCDLGYLRRPYRKSDGSLGYRCPGEPVEAYVVKGGKVEDTEGRKCLCNALLANIGLAQIHEDESPELPLVTVGDDVSSVMQFVSPERNSYAAVDVIQTLLSNS